jgi:hypothetical protein
MQKFLSKFIVVFFVFNSGLCYSQYDFWGDLEPGQYKTGYKRIVAVDIKAKCSFSQAGRKTDYFKLMVSN